MGGLFAGSSWNPITNPIPEPIKDKIPDPVKPFVDPQSTASGIQKVVKKPKKVTKVTLRPNDITAPTLTLDKNTGKNISKNVAPIEDVLFPGTGTPGGVRSLFGSGISSDSTFRENLASFLDKASKNPTFPNAFGNRGAGERLTGVTPQESGNKSNPYYRDPNSTAPGGGPEGLYPGSTTPDGKVTFPGEDKSSWNGLIGADENAADAGSPIERRYALLQSNLRGQEKAQQGMEQDALSRRFAAMGASNSGAAIKNMQISKDTGARRLGEQSNALAAQQSSDQQAAIEAANARNLQRQGLRMGSEEETRNRALEQAKIAEGSRQFEKEFELNSTIAAQNMAIARDALRSNSNGFLQGIFGEIFGKVSMNGITGGK